jgi:DNA-directed RNA polymerase subunit RPC12/RpoP
MVWTITATKGKPERQTMIAKCQCQHCGQKFEVNIEDEGRTAFCPQCGKETALSVPPPRPAFTPSGKIKYGWIYLLSAIAVVIICTFLFAGPIGNVVDKISPPPESSAGTDSKNNSPVVSISDVKAEMPDYGGMDIVGCIKNLTTGPLDSVSVNYSIFDDNGNKVDDSIDFISKIGAGETWKFKVISLKDGGKTYRLEGITTIVGRAQYQLRFKEEP